MFSNILLAWCLQCSEGYQDVSYITTKSDFARVAVLQFCAMDILVDQAMHVPPSLTSTTNSASSMGLGKMHTVG